MAIYADKKNGKPTGRWMVEVAAVAARPRQRKRFDSMAEAKAAEARWKAGHVDDLPATVETRPALTLRDLADEAIPVLWQRNAERQADATSKVRVIIDWVGNPAIKDIDFRWLANLSLTLTEQGRALATINRYLTCLHSLLAYASEAKQITEMPSFKRLWQDEDEGRIRWLTAEEEHKLLSFLEEAVFGHVRDFVTVAIDTGCRRGELLQAQPDWVQNGVLYLPAPKTKDAQEPLDPANRSIQAHP